MDKDKILQYLERLGKAVTGCLNDSDEVKNLTKLIEEAGLSLNLSFVVMISGARPLAFPVTWSGSAKELKFEITQEDRAFLQGLGIKYDENAEGAEPGAEPGGADEGGAG